ncbi:MAG: hypothetical protein E6600_04680 [Anaerocolumna aminovalerica]|uniref:hypothetical protein n=1 Tax=Anaerocolumna aminovalerica TaxID=1527 RepID=UPI002913E344|nr:hypothetical protein [Anaerocolumna aminovalerica]MDU6263778.1 hypothetical protein [Anaerocolumna aminovalerica]
MKIDTLEVMSRMSKKNNKELKLSPLSNIKSMQSGKNGWGEARIALPNDLIIDYLINPDHYIGGLLICKKDEFQKEKELLISEVSDHET